MSLAVLTSEQMQQWDKFTIENEPIASIDLMERAASLATKSILGRNSFQSVSIFCGPGNNGGDGLVIARILSEVGKKVCLYILDFGNQTDDFKANFKRLPNEIDVQRLNEKEHTFHSNDDLFIDCIFGSGLDRKVSGWIGKVIDQINSQKKKTIAIDIPSGLFSSDNSDNIADGHIIRADETLTFMTPKLSFFFETNYSFVGNFRILDIELHPDFKQDDKISFLIEDDIVLNARERFDHKGTSGCLLLITGFSYMTGAALIASKAALRSGARYLYTCCGEEGRTALNSAIPEVLWVSQNDFIVPEKVKAIGIGPGLGTDENALSLLKKSLKAELPIVLDADAINLLSTNKNLISELPDGSILTPHIGELNRLIGKIESPEELLRAQLDLSIKHNIFIIQKGPFSKLTCPDGNIIINSTGNPGMSTAGMGDALTGIIASLLSQGYSPEEAAKFGMFIHGEAADAQSKEKGEIGLLASDVIDNLPKVIGKYLH